MSTITDPRAVRSRQALHGALLTLLEIKPLEQITVRDIAAQAGVGYATFFRHHPTKEALLDDIAAEQIRNLFSLALPAMDTHDLRASAVALFTYVDAHRALWTTLLTGGAAAAIREELLRQAREVAVLRPASGGCLPVEASVLLMVSGTLELLTWWLRQRDPLPAEQIADLLYSVVVSPAIAASNTEPRE